MLSSSNKKDIILNKFKQNIDLFSLASELLIEDIEAGINLMSNCIKKGGTIFWCGNGGSASDAQHLAAELVCRYIKDRKPIRSLALNTDTSLLTAISNDYSYEKIFSRQIEALGNSNDLLIPISTSGNSSNIINVIKVCKKLEIGCFGLLGKDGGHSASLLRDKIIIPSENTANIQELHIFIGHLMIDILERELGFV